MFVERKHRKEITERVSADGEIQTPLDGAEVREAVRSIVEDGMTSIAVCLLNSYRNPDHERRIRDIATEEADVSVTTSSAVMPEIREYERTLKRWLRDFGIDEPVYVMQANGGIVDSGTLAQRSLQLINSGPAAGVIGARRAAREFDCENIITLDIGGTSADACIVRDGEIETTTEGDIDDLPLLFPQTEVRTVGAGGTEPTVTTRQRCWSTSIPGTSSAGRWSSTWTQPGARSGG